MRSVGLAVAGADSRDVRYFDGSATARIALTLDGPRGAAETGVTGRVVYRVCDTATSVWVRREHPYRESLAAPQRPL